MSFQSQDDFSFSLRNLQEELNRVFDRVWHSGPATAIMHGVGKAPAVDVYEFADRYVLLADVPGVPGDEIDVSFLDGELTIRGEIKPAFEADSEGSVVRIERRGGAFSRSVPMPAGINANAIAAKCKNGLLEVTLPKIESASPHAVKVEACE
ncbi:MAG: Hsp20/alpha crystallin family protein [Planctomycetota bacterium]|jgi:HSP20 family protein